MPDDAAPPRPTTAQHKTAHHTTARHKTATPRTAESPDSAAEPAPETSDSAAGVPADERADERADDRADDRAGDRAGDHAVRPARRELLERFERASGVPEREVRLVDAQAIRAIAHEARQRVIDVLYTERRSYTATQLAELTGLSPSAMSYHLRALERWGVVERDAEATDDARTRPWRATGTTIAVTGEGTAVEAAQDVLFANTTAALRQRMRVLRSLPREERAHYVGLASGELWLTDEQIEELSLVVERAVVELAESGWANEPAPGRTRTAFVWSLLPDPYPGRAGRQEDPRAAEAPPEQLGSAPGSAGGLHRWARG